MIGGVIMFFDRAMYAPLLLSLIFLLTWLFRLAMGNVRSSSIPPRLLQH